MASVDNNNAMWQSLVAWIEGKGGNVHPSLSLRESDTPRGIFATAPIAQGETLIRLTHSIDGRTLPSQYGDRNVSPWLRCLAAFLMTQDQPYLDSLPTGYDTLWDWNDEELALLKGTTLEDWKEQALVARERYLQQVRPYLEHLNLVPIEPPDEQRLDKEYDLFLKACQCLSTRAFHCESTDEYQGPFLLPVIDLLNHSTSRKCTTLQRTADGAFVMVAERSIAVDEEVVHSYGDALTSTQLLKTFGFVPKSRTRALVLQSADPATLSPVLLRKSDILQACWQVIDSELPQRLKESMQEQDLEDEVWDLAVDRSRDSMLISEDLLVDATNPLSDELVTLACLPFLPKCAYSEARSSLLDASLLEDYYLGKLVCSALLKVLECKLNDYGETVETVDSLLSSEETRRVAAHTIRLEERASLDALRVAILHVLEQLDEDDDDAKRMRID